MGLGRGFLVLWATSIVFAQAPEVRLVRIASGLNQPVDVANAGDGTGRLFAVQQTGQIRMVETPAAGAAFLDISDRVSCCGERGLLSVAFPPGFAQKRYFYVYYTNRSGDIVVSRFRLLPSGLGDPASEEIILTISHRTYGNHNGGQLAFGPDGYLYVGTGDGGGAGDTLRNGQNTNSLLAKILRIDVEQGTAPYSVPPANPFVSRSGYRPEIWALGLRNPWRLSFDRANGDLYIGDVGQNTYEEIDWQPASSPGGENYGWNTMEGAHCFTGACNQAGLTLPVAEYTHATGGCSVTGGYVYRGVRIPALQGSYVYGDYCSGRIWILSRQGDRWQSAVLLNSGFAISTFGEDEAGELYVANLSGGDLYRFESSGPSISAAGVVNAASFEAGISPGGLATVFGVNLTATAGIVRASAFPLPVELGGARVLVNGVPAPLLAAANVAGQEQISFQTPFEVAPGRATLRVVRGGQESGTVEFEVLEAQPGIFAVDGYAAALRSDYVPLAVCSAQTCPAVRPGEVVMLYATGLGSVSGAIATGAPAPDAPLLATLRQPEVTIGGRQATVMFSGLAPRYAGLYQINVRLAADTPAGPVDVVITAGGRSSKPAKLRVE